MRSSNPRFLWTLTAISAVALAVRVAYVLIDRDGIKIAGDAYFYHAGANLLADGRGFIEPYFVLTGKTVQAAEHPPLYLIFLGIPSFLGMTSTLTHLLWSCMLGTATVFVVGYLGLVVKGARVGIIAALIAALYPNFWIPDGSLEAETGAMFFTALTLLLAYRYLQRPSMWRLCAVGAAAGGGALVRTELILLVPLVVAPLAFSVRPIDWRIRLRWLAAAALAALVVIGPWIGYNLSRFRHPVYLSSQYPALLSSANCDTAYYGSLIGYFAVQCTVDFAKHEHPHGDQSESAIAFQRAALRYIDDHKGRVPVVVAARVGRILELFKPGQNLQLREYIDRVEPEVADAALWSYYLLAILSIVGVCVLRKARARLWPLVAVVGLVLITVVVTYATPRFRTTAEVALAILSAVAIDAGITRARDRRAQRESAAHVD